MNITNGKKVIFIEDNWMEYGIFKNKEYTPIFESKDNYLIRNELNGNSIVPKINFIVIHDS